MSFLFNGCSGLGADLVHVQDDSAQQKTNITGLSAERVTSGLAVKVEGSLYREPRGDATVADRLIVSYGMAWARWRCHSDRPYGPKQEKLIPWPLDAAYGI